MLLPKLRLPTTMPDSRGKFSLDELMRAKRNEQPSSEFWTQFDREFKAKQKLLIQKQLVQESRLKYPAARVYKLGAFAATCGVAALAVYLGFQAPVEQSSPIVAANQNQAPQPANFSVAKPNEALASQSAPTNSGLQEFATLARHSEPRVVVRSEPNVVAQEVNPSQLNALKTLAALEETIRAQGPAPTPAYQFVSSTGLFEDELAHVDEQQLDGFWDFEQAYLLGRYADPLTGTLDGYQGQSPIGNLQNVRYTQLDEALSSSQGARGNKSLDALTVRF